MSAITPGPWEVMESHGDTMDFNYCIRSPAYGVVGYWHGHKDHHGDNFWRLTKEDAQVIAAAPELLNALQSVMRELPAALRRGHANPDTLAAFKEAEAALAKATGAQP